VSRPNVPPTAVEAGLAALMEGLRRKQHPGAVVENESGPAVTEPDQKGTGTAHVQER
jgi:hypothetical protein